MRQTDERLKCCICITLTDKPYMYRDADSITLVNSSRDFTREWDGWECFNAALDPRSLAQLAANMGIPLRFKKGSKEELSLEVWSGLCYLADDRRAAADKLPTRDALTGKVKGKRGRPRSNLSSRKYIMVPVKGGDRKTMLDDCPCTTRQARKVWEFFVDEYLATNSLIVTEGRMRDIVNDRAEELRTKQDPWRIFCYYRPELMDCQLVKYEK